ncbi:MAG: RES family NAD+ phosphorylase [bacterium]|nr:RES family NAD+ phosphorylase [bacterium]MDE0287881.1 RES family NAD+ phosphorylase [bacterium]MDE0438628.1 RES family NAD+ phosphorylase [bacterium]
MLSTPIGGSYYRVADPDWADPFNTSYAAAFPGQRWNPAGLACLYLNHDIGTARANVMKRFVGLPFGPEDLNPATAPLLLRVDIPDGRAADAYTDAGLDAIGLPATYPYDDAGDLIPHNMCQPIGEAAYEAGLDGVDCRSAAIDDGRELAWFPRSRAVSETSRLPFSDWW